MSGLTPRANPDFFRLWTGQAAASFATALAALAYPLIALQLTNSAGLAGLIGLGTLGGTLLVRLPAGLMVDRWPLKPTLVAADRIRVAATIAVAVAMVTDLLDIAGLVCAAFIGGACAGYSQVGQSVAVRHVVEPAQLPVAFALNDGRGHAVGLLGQPVGGLLFSLGAVFPLCADAVASGLSAILTASVRRQLSDSPTTTSSPQATWRRALAVGVHHIWSDKVLRATLLTATAINFLFTGVNFVVLAILNQTGVSATMIGVAFGIAAAGGITGATIAPGLIRRLRPVYLFVAMGTVAVLGTAALTFTASPLLAGALLGVINLAAVPANAVLSSVQILRTPKPLQGRVVAAAHLIAGAAAPVATPLAGLAYDHIGQHTTLGGASLALLATTICMLTSRSIRDMRLDPTNTSEADQ